MFGNPLRSAYRAKTKCTRLINSNIYQWHNEHGQPYTPQFFTFTYAKAKGNDDLTKTNNDWKLFVMKLNYQVFNTKKSCLKFVCVPEIQEKRFKKYKKKVWHYHAIFFNLPADIPVSVRNSICSLSPTEVKNCLWHHGSGKRVEFKSLEAQEYIKNNAGSYISKYIAKSMQDPKNLGKRRFLASQGLKKPSVFSDVEVVYTSDSFSGFDEKALVWSLGQPSYTFKDNSAGEFTYQVYNSRVDEKTLGSA